MPAWDEYKEIARGRGALALELYVVNSTPVGAPDAVRDTLPRHLDYQKQLEADGNLFLAGPVSDETGEQMEGAGMMIYRAGSLAEATKLAEGDPMHAEGARTFTIRKWLVNEGSPRFATALSDKRVMFS